MKYTVTVVQRYDDPLFDEEVETYKGNSCLKAIFAFIWGFGNYKTCTLKGYRS